MAVKQTRGGKSRGTAQADETEEFSSIYYSCKPGMNPKDTVLLQEKQCYESSLLTKN